MCPSRLLGRVCTVPDRTRGRSIYQRRQHPYFTRREQERSYLLDTGNLDATSDDMRLHRLAAHVSNLGLYVLDLAVVHLRQQTRHVRVHHRREQLRVERRVAETLLEAVARVVVAAGVHLGLAQLVRGGDVVPERRLEVVVDVRLEADDEQDRGDRREPVERLESVLQSNSWRCCFSISIAPMRRN